MFGLHVRQIFVAPLHVLQLAVQAWQRLLIPVEPSGHVALQVVLERKLPFVQERQSLAEVQVKQGETQAVH